MADGAKGAVIGAIKDTYEVGVKPVVDEVGQALEQGVKTVISGPQQQTSQQLQQKREEDQKNIAEARRKIKFWQDLEVSQRVVRQQADQKRQQEGQQKKEEQKVKQFEVSKKKQQMTVAQQQARKTEMKKGVGG